MSIRNVNKKANVQRMQKMYLLKEPAFRKWIAEHEDEKNMLNIDRQMKKIMKLKNISSLRKWLIYTNFLSKYMAIIRAKRKNNGESKKSDEKETAAENSIDEMGEIKRPVNRIRHLQGINIDPVERIDQFTENPVNDLEEKLFQTHADDIDISNFIDLTLPDHTMRTVDDASFLRTIPNDEEIQEQIEQEKEIENEILRTQTIKEHLARAPKRVRDNFPINKQPARQIELKDGETIILNLDRMKISKDGEIMAEDMDRAYVVLDNDEVDNETFKRLKKYLVEKHNLIDQLIDENEGNSGISFLKSPEYKLKENSDSTTDISWRGQKRTVDSKYVDDILKQLDSTLSRNKDLPSIVKNVKEKEFNSKKEKSRTTSTPKRLNLRETVLKNAAESAKKRKQAETSTNQTSAASMAKTLLTTSKRRTLSKKRLRKNDTPDQTKMVESFYPKVKQAKFRSSTVAKRLNMNEDMELDDDDDDYDEQRGSGLIRSWEKLYKY